MESTQPSNGWASLTVNGRNISRLSTGTSSPSSTHTCWIFTYRIQPLHSLVITQKHLYTHREYNHYIHLSLHRNNLYTHREYNHYIHLSLHRNIGNTIITFTCHYTETPIYTQGIQPLHSLVITQKHLYTHREYNHYIHLSLHRNTYIHTGNTIITFTCHYTETPIYTQGIQSLHSPDCRQEQVHLPPHTLAGYSPYTQTYTQGI